MNLYSILGIQPNSTENEIKKAYHRLALLYHPDKCKDKDASEKFQNISYAYNILINSKTRQEYCKLSNNDQNNFSNLLQKIFKNKLDINDLKKYGINFEKSDWEYLKENFIDLFNALNFQEIFNLFNSGKFPKKKIDINNFSISETDNETDNQTTRNYYEDYESQDLEEESDESDKYEEGFRGSEYIEHKFFKKILLSLLITFMGYILILSCINNLIPISTYAPHLKQFKHLIYGFVFFLITYLCLEVF